MPPSGEALESLRTYVRRRFAELGAAQASTLQEAVLVRGGYYCGRRFQCDGLQAVWFVEEHQLKLFDREGQLVQVERPPGEDGENIRAA